MAQHRAPLDRETFSCSICLDLLKEPVAIPCGHSYCLTCIKGFWDGEGQKEVYSCPQCRHAFTPRPVLVKNTMLAALVEQLKATEVQDAAAAAADDDDDGENDDRRYAGPEDVSCDVCTGRKLKALKSCLVCLVSYCESHLRPHYESTKFKKHKLVEPSGRLQENLCPRHDEVMKVFCRTDQRVICFLCSVDEHKGHDAVSAAAERDERQKEFEGIRQTIQQRIQDVGKDVKLLQQEAAAIRRSADEALKATEKVFPELIRLLQKMSVVVKQKIRSRLETEMSRVKMYHERLQQKIGELKRKDADLELLSRTEDHIQFLHSYPSLSRLDKAKPGIKTRPLRHFEDVTTAVLELRDQLQNALKDKWTNISVTVTEVDTLLSEPGPKTRAGFLKYSHEITLDPNTAYNSLLLSDGNRKAEFMSQPQPCSDHPDRFTGYCQVLSRESLTGRCYWEVEWGGGPVCVAVAYKNISRSGRSNQCRLGFNDKSWALQCDTNSYTFLHDEISTPVSSPVSSKVGVYLDHGTGLLSFHSVSDTMTLLHRVQTTFTQPLHAAVFPYDYGVTAEFCKPK